MADNKSAVNKGRKKKIAAFMVKKTSPRSTRDLKGKLLQIEKMLHPGFHAVCFVIDPLRFSDVQDQFQPIMQYFGDDASDYAFVIMTYTKNEVEREMNFPYYRDGNHPGLTSVLKFCKSKELYIDNRAYPDEKREMISEILSSIDSANVRKLIPHFSSRFKQQTEAEEASARAKAAAVAKAAKVAEAARAAKEAELVKTTKALIYAQKAAEAAHRATEDARAARKAEAAIADEAAKDAEKAHKEELRREREAMEAYKIHTERNMNKKKWPCCLL